MNAVLAVFSDLNSSLFLLKDSYDSWYFLLLLPRS